MIVRRLGIAAAIVAVALATGGPAVAARPATPSGTLTIYTHQVQREVLVSRV